MPLTRGRHGRSQQRHCASRAAGAAPNTRCPAPAGPRLPSVGACVRFVDPRVSGRAPLSSAAMTPPPPQPPPQARTPLRAPLPTPDGAWTPGRTVRGHGRCVGAGPGFDETDSSPGPGKWWSRGAAEVGWEGGR